ncbi:MAG: iron-sulfur cluster assembly protein [Thermoplasmata archaeon]|nr:iron-sulfur cluster assembly protein [Thermoplasmata archaeon]
MSDPVNEKAIEALKGVLDPHTGLSVWDMGLIHDMKHEAGAISLTFIPTSPFCPLGIQLAFAIKKALAKLEGISLVKITIEGHMNAVSINEMLAKD